MKPVLIMTLAAALITVATGCGSPAPVSEAVAEPSAAHAAAQPPEDAAGAAPSIDGRQPDSDAIIAQIVSVSGETLTVNLAEFSKPQENRAGTMPDGEAPGEPPTGQVPEELPSGEAPQRGPSQDGRSGEGRGRRAAPSFSDESTTYTLSGSLTITKGMDGGESLSATDLSAGDTVRLTLDDDSTVAAIQVMGAPDSLPGDAAPMLPESGSDAE